jgi:hypothetical protein
MAKWPNGSWLDSQGGDWGLRIADCGFKKEKKTEILLWERLSAAILRLQRFERF